MHPIESKATLLILLSLSVDKYALVANVESYSNGGAVDMLIHRIVDVVLVYVASSTTRPLPPRITTANQKSVKNWSSEHIGGVPTSLICYPHHPVCTILIIYKKTDVGVVCAKMSFRFIHSRTAVSMSWYHYQSKERQKLIKWLYWQYTNRQYYYYPP